MENLCKSQSLKKGYPSNSGYNSGPGGWLQLLCTPLKFQFSYDAAKLSSDLRGSSINDVTHLRGRGICQEVF